MKTKIFATGLSVVLLFLASDLLAQYNTGVGLRIGGTSGVTVKHFYKPATAIEGIIGGFGNGFSLTALWEHQQAITGATGLYVYYGGGPHLAFYNGYSSYYGRFGRQIENRSADDVGFGINGIVGLEYRLPDNIPIAFSFDIKPFIEIGTAGYVAVAPDAAFGVKFLFK